MRIGGKGTAGPEGGIFISYRRDDSPAWAGRIYDVCERHFGHDQVFMDIDDIPIGADFRNQIDRTLDRSSAVVAVIGPRWLDSRAPDGSRRIDIEGDFVVTEIARALDREILIIPVLVDGAQMPSSAELPPSLTRLASINALSMSHESFTFAARKLVERLTRPNHTPPSGTDHRRRRRRRAALLAASLGLLLLFGAAATTAMNNTAESSGQGASEDPDTIAEEREGWIAVFQSIPEQQEERATRRLAQFRAVDPDIEALNSDDYTSLVDGYIVIYRGLFVDSVDALNACRAMGRETTISCYARFLTRDPTADPSDPSLLRSPN